MVFIRKSAGRSGSTKVQLAERREGRNHILEHVGTARSEAELAVLMAKARERLRPGQEALDLVVAGEPVSGRPGVITGKRSAVLWRVLSGVYDRLGFDVLGDDAFKQLVLARIIEPTSKADSLRVLEEIGVEHASLRTMFRCLQRAGAGDYRSQIAAACFDHASTHGDVSLCLYDVTTLYFEAENEDELRKVGFSKERRVDPQIKERRVDPQIVVGLLVDRAGHEHLAADPLNPSSGIHPRRSMTYPGGTSRVKSRETPQVRAAARQTRSRRCEIGSGALGVGDVSLSGGVLGSCVKSESVGAAKPRSTRSVGPECLGGGGVGCPHSGVGRRDNSDNEPE